MRSENSLKSAITAIVSHLFIVVIGFVSQAIFVKTLGKEYLGINGLFNNILSMLAIVELGFGAAIIVNLYKPVANKEYEKVKSLLYFYKKIYRIIALIVLVLGLLILPFLNYIAGTVNINENLHFIFVLYLIDIVVSYLLTYKRSILHANQKNYIINIIHLGYVIVLNALQMTYLLVFKEFIGYLIIKIVCRVLENVIITIVANKKYPYIKEKNIEPLNNRLKKLILIRVKGLIFHKIGGFIVLGSDNIIISMLPNLGIIQVGLYSNYSLIISAVSNLMGQVFNSLMASIGNLLVENNKEKTFNIYKATLFLNSWMSAFSAISFYVISKPFVSLWLGSDYLLANTVVFILTINFYINNMRRTYAVFKEAAGVFYQDRFVPLIESAVNIIASIILGYFWGLSGIFLGTIASNMVLFLFSFPKYVYKKILHGSIKGYIKDNTGYALLFGISFTLTILVSKLINVNNIILELVFNIIICLVIPNIIYFLTKRKSQEYAYLIGIAKNIKKRKS